MANRPPLFSASKYTVGSQFQGQQGYTNKETGAFELTQKKHDMRIRGPDDDTQGLVSRYSNAPGAVPRQPRVDRFKRARVEDRADVLDYGPGP